MFVDTRDGARRQFLETWRKMREAAPLSPLEALIAAVIERHPEYHELLRDGAGALAKDFGAEAPAHNPFLHMGLHIALAEQVGTDRPPGIRAIHARLLAAADGPEAAHAVEHRMIDCLAEALWRAQRGAGLPDERAYLDALSRLR
jgi:hypothetical protein